MNERKHAEVRADVNVNVTLKLNDVSVSLLRTRAKLVQRSSFL